MLDFSPKEASVASAAVGSSKARAALLFQLTTVARVFNSSITLLRVRSYEVTIMDVMARKSTPAPVDIMIRTSLVRMRESLNGFNVPFSLHR